MNWRRGFRYLYIRFVRIRATPAEISLGLAIGVFWGMFPLPGLQMAVAVITAAFFRGNKLAAAAGTWLSNPLTTLPLTALNFQVGQWVLGREAIAFSSSSLRSVSQILELGGDILISYSVGCLVVGSISAPLIYFLGLPIIHRVQHRVAARRATRRRKQLRRWR
jgi:uncharacterized protein (DUF2062 family)